MTRVFGILGYPLGHTLSPLMHKAAYEALSLDALYAPFETKPKELRYVLRGLDACLVDGLNVTIPHKQAVYKLLGKGNLDKSALEVGAVNTLVRENNRLVGYNSDVAGVRRAITDDLKLGLKGSSVLLLGAGGAARAVSWALLSLEPASITISNIIPSDALVLSRWLKKSARRTKIGIIKFDEKAFAACAGSMNLLVNATSVGMKAADPSPFPLKLLRKDLAVFDVVYGRHSTKLIKEAKRRGALAESGVAMLVYQGAEAFRLWWGIEPPVDVMRRAVLSAIAGK